MSIDGQGHFFTIYFPGFVCFVLYLAKIAGERLQDHWSSGLIGCRGNVKSEFSKKACFSRISRLKVTYMFMALTNSLVLLFIAVLLQIF